MQHRFEYLLLRALRGIVVSLPLRTAQALGARLGGFAHALFASRRRVALENLERAFPGMTPAERERIACGAFRNYGITFLELLWAPNLTTRVLDRLVVPGEGSAQLIRELHGRGRGLIVNASRSIIFASGSTDFAAAARLLKGRKIAEHVRMFVVPGTQATARRMADDGLFLDEAEPFGVLLERCRVIQQKVNAGRLQK